MANQDQITGILRIIVPVICTWLATSGFSLVGSAEVQAQILAIATGLISVIWSYFAWRNSSKIKNAANIDPQIKIIVPQHVAAADSGIAAVVKDNLNYPNVSEKK